MLGESFRAFLGMLFGGPALLTGMGLLLALAGVLLLVMYGAIGGVVVTLMVLVTYTSRAGAASKPPTGTPEPVPFEIIEPAPARGGGDEDDDDESDDFGFSVARGRP